MTRRPWSVRAMSAVVLRLAPLCPMWSAFRRVEALGACLIEIGTRGPQQWTRDFDVVARYCWRGGTTTAGTCD